MRIRCSKALESGFPPIFFLQIQPKVQPSEVMAVVGPLATGYPLVTPELSWYSDGTQKRGLSREEIHFIANFSQKV